MITTMAKVDEEATENDEEKRRKRGTEKKFWFCILQSNMKYNVPLSSTKKIEEFLSFLVSTISFSLFFIPNETLETKLIDHHLPNYWQLK